MNNDSFVFKLYFVFMYTVYFPGFLRKVYGILTAQILLTTIVAALFMVNEPIQHFVQHR